jgi:hypothetical protein
MLPDRGYLRRGQEQNSYCFLSSRQNDRPAAGRTGLPGRGRPERAPDNAACIFRGACARLTFRRADASHYRIEPVRDKVSNRRPAGSLARSRRYGPTGPSAVITAGLATANSRAAGSVPMRGCGPARRAGLATGRGGRLARRPRPGSRFGYDRPIPELARHRSLFILTVAFPLPAAPDVHKLVKISKSGAALTVM